jgi:hypothetical protein
MKCQKVGEIHMYVCREKKWPYISYQNVYSINEAKKYIACFYLEPIIRLLNFQLQLKVGV